MSKAEISVRQPRFADNQWYSSDQTQLQTDIQRFLDEAAAKAEPDSVIGLVAPHAGLFFSGHVAGAVFAGLTPNTFDTVILIGPDHRGAAPGQMSTVQANAWRTPLGDIPVDWEIIDAIRTDVNLKSVTTDHEHSLEIELPFLQITLQEFKLAPLMMGDQTPTMCRRLGEAMAKAVQNKSKTLLVASSDLSHFYDDETARRLDEATLQFVLDMDADGLIEHVEAGWEPDRTLACGAGPIATVIHAAKAMGATRAQLLQYATSADVYPGKNSVVGYAAVAISK